MTDGDIPPIPDLTVELLRHQLFRYAEDLQEVLSQQSKLLQLSHHEDESQELSELAFHDPLTGLPNRRLLESRLGQAVAEARRKSAGLAVLYVGVVLGRGASDSTVLEVSRRLQAAVRPGDFVARVGVDEFVVILSQVESDEVVSGIISFLLYSLDTPIHTGERALFVNLSIGASRFPCDGDNKAELIERAQAAMVCAKRLSGRYAFWKAP